MACHDKDMEDRVKRLGEELRLDAKLDVLMELIISLAFRVKHLPPNVRERALSKTIAAIRDAWAKEP